MKIYATGFGLIILALCAVPSTLADPPDRQGGDTCENALPIFDLPCVVYGTTVGYTNDYDEVCPYQGSTAPDVVYSYTAYYNAFTNISLCLDVTNYDSKLYIYEDECTPGTAIACNDDACSSPYFAQYVSEISHFWFLEGHTYYIVVDGYGTSAGEYQLNIDEIMLPPPGACCNDATGECVDDALEVDCVGPNMRFGANMFCVDLNPPCGNGGCCFGYRCSDTPLNEEDCLAMGGEFLGYGVSCMETLCNCGGADYRGDSNCLSDGVDSYDIDGFIQAIGNPTIWVANHSCNYYCANDINCDGDVNSYDIDGFITCIGQTYCDPCP
ncbi:MAG: hypothetical protein ABIG44_12500 [Planctomycetota bacterium]